MLARYSFTLGGSGGGNQPPTAAFTHTTTQNVTVTTDGGGPADVIINEVLANEPGSNTTGEAVEIVTIGGTAISIADWTVRDGTALRHAFAAGTTLQPGKAITVFGGASAIPDGSATGTWVEHDTISSLTRQSVLVAGAASTSWSHSDGNAETGHP